MADNAMLDYLRKRRRQMRLFITLVSLSAFCVLSAAGLLIWREAAINRRYALLCGVSESTDYDQRRAAYVEAVKLRPQRPLAYERLLSAYESEGVFDLAQSAEFTALYNSAKDLGKEEGAGEMTYLAGRMYLVLYTENGEQTGMSTKVRKAASYFSDSAENPPGDPQKAAVARCYDLLCRFYKDFILAGTGVRELTEQNVDDLLTSADEAMDALENSEDHDRLMFAAAICNVLFDQRHELAKAAPGKGEQALSLMERAYAMTGQTEVTKEVSVNVKAQIEANRESFLAAVADAFKEGGAEHG